MRILLIALTALLLVSCDQVPKCDVLESQLEFDFKFDANGKRFFVSVTDNSVVVADVVSARKRIKDGCDVEAVVPLRGKTDAGK